MNEVAYRKYNLRREKADALMKELKELYREPSLGYVIEEHMTFHAMRSGIITKEEYSLLKEFYR